MLTTVIIAAVLLIAGAVLLRVGLVGRRLDDHPVCRACRFDLVGVYEPGVSADQSVRCPECGAELSPVRIRRGNRRKRTGAAALGGLLLMIAVGLGGALGWGAASGFNWNTVKPAWLLQREAVKASPPTARAALMELLDRLESEELGEARTAELVAIGLERQADLDRAWEPLWGDFIETARFVGQLDDADWARFLRQSVPDSSIDVATRSRLRAGDPVPCQVTISNPRLGERTSVMLNISSHAGGFTPLDSEGGGEPGEPSKAGEGRAVEIERGQAMLGLAGGGSGRVSWDVGIPLPVGRHEVWVEWTIAPMVPGAASSAGDSGDAGGEPIEWTKRITRTIDVVPPGAPLIELVARPELAEAIRESATIQRLSARPDGDGGVSLGGAILFTDPPIDMAFDVIWVVGGREIPGGGLAVAAGRRSHSYSMGGELGELDGDARTVDVILRPSVEAAMQTTDFTRIWDGELRFEDVAVEWPEK